MTEKEQQVLASIPGEIKLTAGDMIALLERQVQLYQEKALYYYLEDGINESERQSYAQMRERVLSVAAAFQKHTVKGDRALLLFPSGISFINALYGCFYSGLIGVPAYAPRKNRSFDRFKAILEDSSPACILATRKIHDDIRKNFPGEDILEGIPFFIYEDFLESQGDRWDKPDISPDDIALLQYTSGSTGAPKGVMISHANMLYNSEFIKQAFGHDETSVGVNWLPGFHDMGLIGALIQPLYIGGSNVIMPPSAFLMRPQNWLKTIGHYKASTAGGPNFALNYCVERVTEEHKQDIDLSSVNPFFCGAEPIRKASLEKFTRYFSDCGYSPDKFYPCYGLAESTLIVTGGNLEDEPYYFYADPDALQKGKAVSMPPGADGSTVFTGCGFPMVGTRIMIVHPESKEICSRGEIGEIWASGPSIAKGYWNDSQATDITFNAFTSGGEGPFMRTGDLGFIEAGQLFVSGRIKDLIIIRGMNHYPQDIEASVEDSHEALMPSACAAFSVEAGNEEKLVVVAEVKRAFLRNLDEEEIYSAIRQAIADNHLLQVHAIVLTKTGSNPKTSSGKVQHFECRNNYLDDSLNAIASWTSSVVAGAAGDAALPDVLAIQEWIKNWMARELKIDADRIDAGKPITSYGLDSLKAVVLARDAEDRFGIEWPLDAFLEETTIEKLAVKGQALMKN